MRRNYYIGLAFVTAVFVTAIAVRLATRPSPLAVCPGCNVVIISVDSLRADVLPCYGYRLPTAPNLCAFANGSVRFTNAFANSTWTRPSNMSIVTSLYPVSHGMMDPVTNTLNPEIRTLPQVLASRGYSTRFVSNDQIHMGIELGYSRIFQHLRLTPPLLDEETVDIWLSAIDGITRDNRRGQPSLVYFHTDHVHDYVDRVTDPPTHFPLDPGYRPPAIPGLTAFTAETWKFMGEYFKGSMQAYRVKSTIDQFSGYLTQLERAKTLAEAKNVYDGLPSDIRHDIDRNMAEDRLNANYFAVAVPLYRHLYDEQVRTLDAALDKVFRRIDENGLSDNTIVIVTSDHGQILGEFKLLGHIVTLAKQEIHIPLIIRAPGVSPRRSDELTQHVDIMPTILELTGIPVPKEAVGISLLGLMRGDKDAPKNQFVISQTTMPNIMNTIVTDRWRLMEARYPNGTYRELFDRVADPKETKSVASAHQDVVERLDTLLYGTLERQHRYIPVSTAKPDYETETDRDKMIESTY